MFFASLGSLIENLLEKMPELRRQAGVAGAYWCTASLLRAFVR